MRQVVLCNGCNNRVPTPESLDGKPSPQFLRCETCGNEFFWNGGLTDNSEPLILFSVDDSAESSERAEKLQNEEESEIESYYQSNSPDSPDAEDSSSDEWTSVVNLQGTVETSETIESEPLDSPEQLEPQQLEPVKSALEIETEEMEPAQLEPEPFELELELELESESDSVPASAEPIVPDAHVETEHETSADWSVLESATARRHPKEASGIRKILPPILGGVAAFPIAILILWYGFGKDIGTTGPTVAKYVPWIVPEKFRNMPLEISPPNIASRRSQGSAPSGRNTLPTLNRDESTEPPKNASDATSPVIATEQPIVEPEQPTPSPQPKTPP